MMPTPGVAGESTILPRTLNIKATILGTQRETSSGYAVQGKSFILWATVPGTPPLVPQQFNVSFAGAVPLYLDEVIDVINTAVSPHPPVAFRNNSFLQLECAVSGEDSYLRLETDVASDVMFQLGLFAEVESRGGGLAQATTIDYDRQIASPAASYMRSA